MDHAEVSHLGGIASVECSFTPKQGCEANHIQLMYKNAKTPVAMSSPGRFYRSWKRAQRDVFKGDKTAVFHTCRHMAATLLANDTMVNTKLIGHLLGHASERTTNRYIHAKKSSLLEAVNMI